MPNIALVIAYDGTDYIGWQKQAAKHGKSIEREISRAVFKATGQTAELYGAGRTDAGVHAKGQVASLKLSEAVPVDRLPAILNRILPPSIQIQKAVIMPQDFHARYHAVGKRYCYTIAPAAKATPFNCRYAWFYPQALDVAALRQTAQCFVGEHDFSAFSLRGSSSKTFNRHIYAIDIQTVADEIQISLMGNGFLYKMVRCIVASLVACQRGKLSQAEIVARLQSGGQMLLPPAPPQGLCLEEVYYKLER